MNHYPMLTWNGQHHGSVEAPNIHLYGHVHALYQREPSSCPVRDAGSLGGVDVGFDGHDYQLWSIAEILEALTPRPGRTRGIEAADSSRTPFEVEGVGWVPFDLTSLAMSRSRSAYIPPSSSSSFCTSSWNSESDNRRVCSGFSSSAESAIRSTALTRA